MNNKTIIFFCVLLFSFQGFSQTIKSKSYSFMLGTLLSTEVPFKDVYEIEDLSAFQLLDAREKEEFEVSHLKNAIWVGYEDFNLDRLENLDKQKPTLVYCSVGYRSEKITQKLLNEGFNQVYNLYGGIFEWANASKPVFQNTKQVKYVHAYDKVWGVWLNIDEKVY